MEKYMLPCLNKKFFGFDCPGCGLQRAAQFLLEGEFTKALHIFPAIYTTILLFAFLALQLLDKSRNYQKFIIITALINVMVVIIAYIYKMTQIL
jgi:dolichyl-phosphate-mannose--protein O-mannosyl transferase